MQDLLNKDISYVDIAKKLNVNRNLIRQLIKRYGLKAKKDLHFNQDFTDEELEALKYMATQQISLNKICLCFHRGKEFIEKTLKDNNIKLMYDPTKPMSSQVLIKCAAKCCKSSDEDSNRNSLTEEELQSLPKLITNMPFLDMCERLNKNPKFIKRIFYICDLNMLLWADAIKDYSYNKIFDNDMMNPMMSNSALSRKYGLSYETIRIWRNEHYGKIDIRANNFYNKSSAEVDFEEILKTLDLAYFYQKDILGYKVDYYLGQKIIVEVQGDYWHTKARNNRNVQQTDYKKKTTLENKGYTVLQIWENDIKNNPQKVAETVISVYMERLMTSKK